VSMKKFPEHPKEISNKKVLMAALDWGFGHVTRMVSVIKILRENGNTIMFAGTKEQIEFLQQDFPFIETYRLDGYAIQLDSRKSTYWQILKQFFRFRRGIRAENAWLDDFISLHPVDYIISDNRYGLYHPDATSIFITHQLNLQLPVFANGLSKRLRKDIERFDQCWIPDTADRKLSGRLSKGKLNIPVSFIGPLNRFKKVNAEKKYDLLIILSGPEPERSNFVEFALAYATNYAGKVAVVGESISDFDSFLNPSTSTLERLIAESETVLSRAGYTTIMEMVGLEKKCILLPTKGQYEQEYLSKHLRYPFITFNTDLMGKKQRRKKAV
jgi:hypothetical protein